MASLQNGLALASAALIARNSHRQQNENQELWLGEQLRLSNRHKKNHM